MTDILERLRECRVVFDDVIILVDAADEIERLRKDKLAWQDVVASQNAEIERLRHELEQLREPTP